MKSHVHKKNGPERDMFADRRVGVLSGTTGLAEEPTLDPLTTDSHTRDIRNLVEIYEQ